MTLNYETKVQIYELRQMEESIKSLSETFSIAEFDIKYMIRLIDRYEVSVVQIEGRSNAQRVTEIIQELTKQFPLETLFKVFELSLITYYYQVKRLAQGDKV